MHKIKQQIQRPHPSFHLSVSVGCIHGGWEGGGYFFVLSINSKSATPSRMCVSCKASCKPGHQSSFVALKGGRRRRRKKEIEKLRDKE
jgi:hypothetical protein